MTDYTTSPHAYQEFMSARERTAYWVQAHSSYPEALYSPSVPPSELGDLMPSSPPSDAGSSLSLPPKMVLRYNDGRPDIPIPHLNAPFPPRRHPQDGYGPSGHRRPHMTAYNSHPISSVPIQPSYHTSGGSGSHGSSPSRTHSRHHEPLGADSSSPEEIRVLPSHAPLPPRSAATSSRQRSHHSRSKSLPRSATDPYSPGEEVIEPLPAHSHSKPAAYPPPSSYTLHTGPQVSFVPQAGPAPWAGVHSSNTSGKHSHGHSANKVPPIVYAPSHNRRLPHYAPPAILHHAPRRGPNGMIYSHSAPVPIQTGPYPAPTGTGDYGERGRRDRTRSLGHGYVHQVQRSDDGEEGSDAESAGSGSTYYVLPAAGQKVHVIAPSPEQSVYTATSTTKSPGSSPRKPFFQRLIHFAKIASSAGGSSKGTGRKLHRRYSTSDTGRQRVPPAEPTPESAMPR